MRNGNNTYIHIMSWALFIMILPWCISAAAENGSGTNAATRYGGGYIHTYTSAHCTTYTTPKTVILWSQGDRWAALKSFSIKLKNWCRLRIQCTVVWQCVKIWTPWQFPDYSTDLCVQTVALVTRNVNRSLLCVRLRVVWVISAYMISSRAFSCRGHINLSTVL